METKIFETREGAVLYAEFDENNNIQKLYTSDKESIIKALEEDLASINFVDVNMARMLLFLINQIGITTDSVGNPAKTVLRTNSRSHQN
jgi:hypothetical protein